MAFQPGTYAVIYFAAAAVAAAAAVLSWRGRSAPGGLPLSLMSAAASWWCFFDALETSSVGIPAHVFWAQVSYVGSMTVCTFLLLYALEYTGRRRVLGWVLFAVFIVPAIGVVAAATNGLHHLVWTGFSVAPGGMNLLVYSRGWLFWVLTLYNYALAAVATVVLVGFALHATPAYRMQGVTVLVAVAIPWVAGIVYDVAPGVLRGVDPAATFAISGVLLSLSLVRFRLLDLAPVARHALIERMEDGLLVLDTGHRVLDSNPAAGRIIGGAREGWVGTDIRTALSAWPALAVHLATALHTDTDSMLISPAGHSINVSVVSLEDPGGAFGGNLITLRDATGQVEAEAVLQSINEDLHRRIAQVEELQEELREQAIRDPLTGLFNRRYLSETLRRELGRAAREGYPVSIVMIDVDRFKSINDEHGHAAGDQVLRSLGAQLRAGIRAGDIACRYGGDELLLVLPNTSVADAFVRAEEWRAAVKESSVYSTEWSEPTTLSLGVAGFPDHGTGSDEVMAAADVALYEAKSAGRDRTVVATPGHRRADTEGGAP